MFKNKSSGLLWLLCGSLLVTSCATPPTQERPITAQELAEMGIMPPQSITQPDTLPITELQTAQAEPLQQVNQPGGLPAVQTRRGEDLDLSQLGPDAPIDLNFEQAELRQVIDTIASALEIPTVIDPTINDKVTIRTPPENKLKGADLWPLLQLLLVDAGVTMERKGNVYHFKKEGPTVPGTIGTERGIGGSHAAEVLQVTPLRYISAEAAINVLSPLLQPTGRILSLPSLNVIGIIASPDRVERVNQLLRIVDADPFLHRGMRLFRLQNSKASEVQADLDKIMQAMAGGSPSAYQVLSLERINGLLVIAPPNSGFKEVEMWVNILDERSEESTEQVFIYNVRNLDAKELASTLSSVFESEREEDQVTPQNEEQNEAASSRMFQIDDGIIVETTPEQTNQPATGSPTAVSAKLTVKIIADEKTNSLIVRATPRDYRQLLETIRILDRAPKEVMVNVVIAEVTLDETTQYGIDWQGILGNARGTIGFNAGTPGGNLPSDVNTSTQGETSSTVSVGGLTGFTLNYVSGGLTALLNLIDENSDVRVLSRPSVLVRNNEEARIEVGSREPIPGASNVSAGGQIVNSAPQYESVGVILSVEPRINDDGIINLKISQEISSLGPTRNGNPSFDQRKVETLVVVRNGTPIVIGGLIQDRYNNSRGGITGLQSIPILGESLFSSTSKNYQRTELVLMMVPEIVNPEIDNSPIVQQFKARMKAIGNMLNRETFHLYSLDRLRMVTEETPLVMP